MATDPFDILRDDPERREEVRRLILTDELLRLPDLVAVLADAQRRTQEQLETLVKQVQSLAEAQRRTEERLASLIDQVSEMAGHVEWLKGDAMERRYRERAASYFAPIARRIHTLTQDETEELLAEAEESGTLTEDEAQEVRSADAILRGRRPGTDAFLVVEASWGVGVEDVTRARDRAELLAKTGRATIAVVAGKWITPDARRAAPELGVWQVANGRVTPPHDTGPGLRAL